MAVKENAQPCMLLSQSLNLFASPLIIINLVVGYLLFEKILSIQLIMQFYQVSSTIMKIEAMCMNAFYYMASSASGQYAANSVF